MGAITPTRLAYQAWCSTPKPIIYETRDDKGEAKTVVVDLLAPELLPNYQPDSKGTCEVCGAEAVGGMPIDSKLSGSYTDWHRHKAPGYGWLCKACVWVLAMNVSAGRQTLFRYTFIASETDGLQICNRAQMRDVLINPPEPPFVAIIALSQKKHLITKATTSYQRDRYYCMLEEECIPVNRKKLERMILTIEALRKLGCVREEIENASFRFERLTAWGMYNYNLALSIIHPWIRDRQYKIALHVAQKSECEDEAKCYLGFAQKT